MDRQMNKNRGFTLIELLISMALLSIVMLMAVQFMSSTAGANKKTQKNLKIQTEAGDVMNNISDSLTVASYIKVVPETTPYELQKTSGTRKEESAPVTVTPSTASLTSDKGAVLSFNLVSDNYGNRVRLSTADERKVIVNMDTFRLVGEKKNTYYPLSGDLETDPDVRSFRMLKQNVGGTDKYIYVKPQYIYAEYYVKQDTGGSVKNLLCNVIYRFVYTSDGGSIYMYRSSEDTDLGIDTKDRYNTAKANVDALTDETGRLTEHLSDYYLSADAEGNALLVDALFEYDGYLFNSADTIKFRNSEVLTVRPQNSYKELITGGSGGSGGSGGTTP